MKNIQFNYESIDFYTGARFIDCVQNGCSHQVYQKLVTPSGLGELLHADWKVIASNKSHSREDMFFQTPDSWGYATKYIDGDDVYIRFASEKIDDAERCMKYVIETAPPVQIKNDSTVSVSFWSVGPQGPQSITRKLQTESWAQINRNYPPSTTAPVEQALASVPPFEAGRLFLWHGQPGTGKSHSIRGLIKHWQPWCDFNYLVDPDRLFQNAASLMTLLLDNDGYGKVNPDDYPDGTFILQGEERWRLFIMEDCDEFLQADAKSRQGQALSRLLNIADGFIGQGLKVLFLITTNEKLQNIHEAVSRTGRCAANTEFFPFTREEAIHWLGYKEENLRDTNTLSDLFDLQRKQGQIRSLKDKNTPVGQYL